MMAASPLEEAEDPNTSPRRLSDLAAQWPETHRLIAEHPNVYDDLLTWLHAYGDADAIAAVEQRREVAAPAEDSAKVLTGVGPSESTTSPKSTVSGPAVKPSPTESAVVAKPQRSDSYLVSDKSFVTASVLMFFFGNYGIDRFYLGRIGTGILKLLTIGGLGLWTMIDGIRISRGTLRAADGYVLAGFDEHKRPVQIIVGICATLYFLMLAILLGLLIWGFAQIEVANDDLSAYSSTSTDEEFDDGSTGVDDSDAYAGPDDGYYPDDGEFGDTGTGDDADNGYIPPDTTAEDTDDDYVDTEDPVMADATEYCSNGFEAQVYARSQSAFVVICSDGYELTYYGESFETGLGITLPAYEIAGGYEAANLMDGVTTVYTVTPDSLVIHNEGTGNVLLDEPLTDWTEDVNAGS